MFESLIKFKFTDNAFYVCNTFYAHNAFYRRNASTYVVLNWSDIQIPTVVFNVLEVNVGEANVREVNVAWRPMPFF